MKVRAWVLDDDEGVRSLVSSILGIRGYDTKAYADPKSCLRRLRNKAGQGQKLSRFGDVIISDIQMPGMTGFEFLEQKKVKGCDKNNIALMSAAWTRPQLQKAKKLGYRVFKKPFNIREMHRWLDEVEQRIQQERLR